MVVHLACVTFTMSKFGSTLTIAMTAKQSECLEEMAKSAGFLWGRCGNISGFFRAIADGYFEIIPVAAIPSESELDCEVSSFEEEDTLYGVNSEDSN